MRTGWTNAPFLAAMMALAGCGVNNEAAEGGTKAGEFAGPAGIVDLPMLRAATWAGETWIANVKGTGPGAEQAQAMQRTKSQFQTCVAEMPGADAVAKIVSTARGNTCTVTVDGIINETMVGGALVRTMKVPESDDEDAKAWSRVIRR